MHVWPIISSLRHHRTAALLIVIEIALTCAIVCNALYLVVVRVERMSYSTGVEEQGLLRVRVSNVGSASEPDAVTARDVAGLRAIPGVTAVTSANIVPLGKSGWTTGVSKIPDDPSPSVRASLYMGSGLLETLGVRPSAGRAFTADEYVPMDSGGVASAIVTRALADALYPGQNPLGKPIYVLGHDPQVIVGVVNELARPNIDDPKAAGFAVVLPIKPPYTAGGNYLIRADSERGTQVLAAAEAVIHKNDSQRVVTKRQTFAALRSDYFRQDSSMIHLLVGLSTALLLIAGLGIVGLSSFWVQQRTRQIGVRRALGATRSDILRYFQIENLLLSVTGALLGSVGAYAINLRLMAAYHVPRLPPAFLPIGALAIVVIGQLAVLGPALSASLIPPAHATRAA